MIWENSVVLEQNPVTVGGSLRLFVLVEVISEVPFVCRGETNLVLVIQRVLWTCLSNNVLTFLADVLLNSSSGDA